MKLLTFDDQLVAYFAADEEDDDLAFIDIIQNPQVADTQLEVRKRLGRRRLIAFVGVVG